MKSSPTTRFYSVRGEHFEWARIWITDDGCFSCLSDYGNFGYWWGSPGCEFRKFLCGVHDGYLMSKLSGGEREYDDDATLKMWRERIIRERREGKFSAHQARHEWELLEHFENLRSREDLARWYFHSGTELHPDYEDVSVYRIPHQLQAFVERLWPLFVEQLRVELASEGSRALIEARQ